MPSGRLPLRIFAKVLHNIGFDLNKRETAVVGYAFRARGGVDVHTGARKRELARMRLDSCQHGNKFGDEYWIHRKDLNLLKESGNQLYVQ